MLVGFRGIDRFRGTENLSHKSEIIFVYYNGIWQREILVQLEVEHFAGWSFIEIEVFHLVSMSFAERRLARQHSRESFSSYWNLFSVHLVGVKERDAFSWSFMSRCLSKHTFRLEIDIDHWRDTSCQCIDKRLSELKSNTALQDGVSLRSGVQVDHLKSENIIERLIGTVLHIDYSPIDQVKQMKPETEKSIKIAIRIRFDSIHSIFDSIRFGLLFQIHNSVRLDSIRLIHKRISYFLFSVVVIMCACKNGCRFLPRAHSFLVLEFISHRIIIVPMKVSTTKKRINTQILAEIPFV